MNLFNLYELGWSDKWYRESQEFKEKGFFFGRISCQHKKAYKLYCEYGEFSAVVSGKFMHNSFSSTDYPVVGDWVVIDIIKNENKAIIHSVLSRKTVFSRKNNGEHNTSEQIISANIDTVFIVNGLDNDFNIRRIERYLTIVWNSGAQPVIILNKADICKNIEEYIQKIESICFGIDIYIVSAENNSGINDLNKYLEKGKTVALVGSSGVGKSTIINSILGEKRQLTGNIREDDSRGKHTTTYRELILIPTGGMIIDTPGMREIQVSVDEKDILETFKDIMELENSCKFNNCNHSNEPGCAINNALKNDVLDIKRYKNYLKLKREAEYQKRRANIKLQQIENKKWKKISKLRKVNYKNKLIY